MRATAAPAAVGEDAARRLVGAYGPRLATFEGGRLHYRRAGGRRYALVPLGGGLFAVDGNPSFRPEFVGGGAGPAARVVGHYHDGRRDENARTP